MHFLQIQDPLKIQFWCVRCVFVYERAKMHIATAAPTLEDSDFFSKLFSTGEGNKARMHACNILPWCIWEILYGKTSKLLTKAYLILLILHPIHHFHA